MESAGIGTRAKRKKEEVMKNHFVSKNGRKKRKNLSRA